MIINLKVASKSDYLMTNADIIFPERKYTRRDLIKNFSLEVANFIKSDMKEINIHTLDPIIIEYLENLADILNQELTMNLYLEDSEVESFEPIYNYLMIPYKELDKILEEIKKKKESL